MSFFWIVSILLFFELAYAFMMISSMFHNVKQLFQTLKQEFNNNKKVALPWDISKMKNDSKRQGFECLSWDNILFYIHTYCLQYERVHFEYLLEMKIFIFFCPMVTDFTNLTRFTHYWLCELYGKRAQETPTIIKTSRIRRTAREHIW